MPIYEYRCQDCGALLEVFQQPSDPSPGLCGYRCRLGPGDDPEVRGSGQLVRVMSAAGGIVRSAFFNDRPTTDQLRQAGFTTFHNEGTGLRRGVGELGPDWVPEDEER